MARSKKKQTIANDSQQSIANDSQLSSTQLRSNNSDNIPSNKPSKAAAKHRRQKERLKLEKAKAEAAMADAENSTSMLSTCLSMARLILSDASSTLSSNAGSTLSSVSSALSGARSALSSNARTTLSGLSLFSLFGNTTAQEWTSSIGFLDPEDNFYRAQFDKNATDANALTTFEGDLQKCQGTPTAWPNSTYYESSNFLGKIGAAQLDWFHDQRNSTFYECIYDSIDNILQVEEGLKGAGLGTILGSVGLFVTTVAFVCYKLSRRFNNSEEAAPLLPQPAVAPGAMLNHFVAPPAQSTDPIVLQQIQQQYEEFESKNHKLLVDAGIDINRIDELEPYICPVTAQVMEKPRRPNNTQNKQFYEKIVLKFLQLKGEGNPLTREAFTEILSDPEFNEELIRVRDKLIAEAKAKDKANHNAKLIQVHRELLAKVNAKENNNSNTNSRLSNSTNAKQDAEIEIVIDGISASPESLEPSEAKSETAFRW